MLALALLAAACSGLGGEPPIVATLPPRAAPTTEAVTFPQQPPDLAAGAEIFAARCSRCHGYDGGGEGELVLTGQIAGPVINFNDLEATRGRTPHDWFLAVTNGNIERLMPPWRDTLSAQQRWDAALYAYTLAYEPGQVARGQFIYEQACASCHGAGGRGDGPEASGPVPDLTDQSHMALASDRALYTVIAEGVGQTMPAFAGELDEAQRQDVVAYVRALTLASRDVIEAAPQPVPPEVAQVPLPLATAEAQPAAPTTAPAETVVSEAPGTVSGTITSGTAGAALPADLKVTLHIVDAAFNEETRETALSPDGGFTFADVPIRSDRRYFTTVQFADGFFVSDLVPGDPTAPDLSLPITVYNVTTDPSVIHIASMLGQIVPGPDGLQVVQIVTFRNDSDSIFLSNEVTAEFQQASVRLTLPSGALVNEFAGSSDRYILTADGAGVIDTQPVFPDENHVVHVMYTLPYTDGAEIVQPLDYPLAGSVQFLLDESLALTSSQLAPRGPQTMGGVTYLTYGGDLELAAGEALRYRVSGAAAQGAGAASGGGSNIVLAAALFAMGAGALLVAALLYWRGRAARVTAAADAPASARQQQIDALVQQIAALDDAQAAGEINAGAYRKQRQALKDRLAALLQEDVKP